MVKKEEFELLKQQYLNFVKAPIHPTLLEYRGAKLQAYLKQQAFTKLQKIVLIGLLLGDGSLSRGLGEGHCYLKIEQKADDKGKAYVDFLYRIFQPWVGTPPQIRYKKNGTEHSYWFRTYRMPQLDHYVNQFYGIDVNGQRRKQIPKLIHKWLNPISVAIWYMDDGLRNKNKNYETYFHSQGFTQAENEVLRDALMSNFNLHVIIQRESKNTPTGEKQFFLLRVPATSLEVFVPLISPYILTEFQYKVPNRS